MKALILQPLPGNDIASGLARISYHLNPAIGKFIGDARHQGRRRINILQDLDNEADSIGKRRLRNCQSRRARE